MIKTIKKDLPIFTFNIGDPYDLETKIPEFRKEHPGYYDSNVKAWHSNFFTFQETHIFDDCLNSIIMLCDKTIAKHYNCLVKHHCSNMWVMEYEEGDYADNHCHYPADWSVVYYINVDENSSPIILENEIEIQPESGLLLIFPGIILHKVPSTKSFRRVMSMNLEKYIEH